MLQEELISHGIGDTVFTRSRNIEQLLGYSNIYIKFEGGNPTGTMKDRAAYACLKVAKEKGYKELAIASCGTGASLSPHLRNHYTCVIPEKYHTPNSRDEKKAAHYTTLQEPTRRCRILYVEAENVDGITPIRARRRTGLYRGLCNHLEIVARMSPDVSLS
jgi:hypothetical protein